MIVPRALTRWLLWVGGLCLVIVVIVQLAVMLVSNVPLSAVQNTQHRIDHSWWPLSVLRWVAIAGMVTYWPNAIVWLTDIKAWSVGHRQHALQLRWRAFALFVMAELLLIQLPYLLR